MSKPKTALERKNVPVFDNRLCRFFFSKDNSMSILRIGRNEANGYVMQVFGGYIDNEFQMAKKREPYLVSEENLAKLFKFSNMYEIPEPTAKELVKTNTRPIFEDLKHIAVRILKY